MSAASRSIALSMSFSVVTTQRSSGTAAFDVLNRCVDANLIAEFRVATPDEIVGIAELRETLEASADRRRRRR